MTTSIGGHAVVIVGYDNNFVTSNGNGAFFVRNSWVKTQWATPWGISYVNPSGSYNTGPGYFWMPYQYFTNQYTDTNGNIVTLTDDLWTINTVATNNVTVGGTQGGRATDHSIGLGVFVAAQLRAKLRQCAAAADMQLLMCGVQEIDVDDWQASAAYSGGFDASPRTVRWLWAVVRQMANEERGALLLVCTASVRAPAIRFARLMGYSGQQQQVRLERVEGSSERLPTAATCFNTIRLPDSYTDEAQLLGRLRRAMREAEGFDEGAVAV
jgi:hypothetical protein